MTENWEIREAGPADAGRKALLLPGGLCTTEFYADVMAEPKLSAAGLGLVAVTLPGFGRTDPPWDVTVENYAQLMADHARATGCDVVVGHSYGANVALEMGAAGLFDGPLVLLSPSFSRKDESSMMGFLDRLGGISGVGPLAWSALVKAAPRLARSSLPPERADTLAAVLGNNDPAVARTIVHAYFQYLDLHGSLAPRLCEAGNRAWVAFGDHDEIGLQPDEEKVLLDCPRVTTVTVPDAGHLLLVEQPAAIADLVLEAAAAV
ncbi:alpha/beta fold hydrolase [Streptomyces mangrovisoli]|uniref:AB hydrolase-1 domain-containing protein n=1 Tax=Streptomyces mangrovisoli TaxID=1428628 RepID=A0A1J4NYC4_9ACTN|nr:alpha/beta hydrolase [Streptomyces mangrovisoli]OIJ66484.1 hypothetical protein WN71_018435 [Streptomyces mangrovisoli]